MANAQYDQKVYIRKKIENKSKRDQEKAMEVNLMGFERENKETTPPQENETTRPVGRVWQKYGRKERSRTQILTTTNSTFLVYFLYW